jgi:predicted SnoaL-like aldol condensation-catalyzing enzyme
MTRQRDGLDHIGVDKRQSGYLLVEYQKMLNSNVLTLYDLMINQKRSEEATAKFVSPSYIQHNLLIPDGAVALGRFFAKITS